MTDNFVPQSVDYHIKCSNLASVDQSISISVFANEIETVQDDVMIKNLEDKVDQTKHKLFCFLFNNEDADADCNKCLSHFSTSFGATTYYIAHTYVIFKLVVFPSTHEIKDVGSACVPIYCTVLDAISEDACVKLDTIFGNDGKLLQRVEQAMKTCNMNVKRELPTPMVYPNLNLSPGKNAVQNENCAKTGYLILDSVGPFLECRDHQCLHIAVTLSTSRQCIHCVSTRIKSPVLLASLSASKVTLLTQAFDVEKIRQACNVRGHCGTIALENLGFCSRYRTSNAIKPRIYPELGKMKRPAFSSPTCLLAHAAFFRTPRTCKNCMQNHFQKDSKLHEYRTSPRTWLLWIRQLGGTASQLVDQAIRDCQSKRSCLKVEQLEETVCIAHEMYMEPTGRKDVANVKVEFQSNRITGNLWPPTHPVVEELYNFDKRSILLVGLAAKYAVDCLHCLMVRSEVFFLYAPTIDSNTGYVWMTQNHDDIIHVCLERNCLKLWFYKEADQLQVMFRRPLCRVDIFHAFSTHKLKGRMTEPV